MHSSSRLPITSMRMALNHIRLASSSSGTKRRQARLSDQFGNLSQQFVQLNRLVSHNKQKRYPDKIIDDKWEKYGFDREIPVIDTPVGRSGKKQKSAKINVQFASLQNVDLKTAKVLIECSRHEYNHYDGMRYPEMETGFPLVSQYWHNNKYADDWFTIKRTQTVHVTVENYLERMWEEFIHLIQPQIYRNIMSMNFKAPTKIQYDFFKAYPNVDHVFMAAETGSGKTLAYGVPVLSKLMSLKAKSSNNKALILTPSTHLKGQTLLKLQQLAENTPLKVVASIKGETYTADDFDVLVSTPGMAYKILKSLGDSISVRYVVIDESDILLDDSFESEIADFLSVVPVKHSRDHPDSTDGAQMIFASATCPLDLTELVNEIVNDQHILYVTSRHLHKIMPNVEQKFIRVRSDEKTQKLIDILKKEINFSKNKVLVFCKDKNSAEMLSKELSEQYGFSNILIAKLKDSFEKLENEKSNILISTDLGSRGLDIENLTHVVNYDFPKHLVDYVHRVGRVGRCSTTSQKYYVTSFVRQPYEIKHVNAIELAARLNRPLHGVEANVAGLLAERKAEQRNHHY
ncbi:hypothetical protein M3Y97_01082400 [Aphelenchoides bicaudatus]|nr:hypothetical protein M3Y97_01082400 [Aphelenchoides bicaudatus]